MRLSVEDMQLKSKILQLIFELGVGRLLSLFLCSFLSQDPSHHIHDENYLFLLHSFHVSDDSCF
jgi:hypothetical protein